MKHPICKFAVTILLVAFAVGGCDSLNEPEPGTSSSSNATPGAMEIAPGSPQVQGFQTFDEGMADIAQERFPGFGGFFYNAKGQPTIYLKRGSAVKSKALNALASAPADPHTVLASLQEVIVRTDVRILNGDYDFAELNRWRKELRRDFLSRPGVTSLDVRESENRLYVGVEEMGMTDDLRGNLEALGIPIAAVEFEEVQPAVNLVADLGDEIRPTRGGLLIESENGGGCTMGLNIMLRRNGSFSTPAFLTNAHCAPPLGEVNGTRFYQPGPSNSYVGEVTYTAKSVNDLGQDRERQGCPPGKTCYHADAAVVEYQSGISSQPWVARPERKWDTRGPSYRRRIDSDDPRFTMKNDAGYPFSGEHLQKVGWRTGWTEGIISENCKDITTNGGSVVKLCQNVVEKLPSAPSGLRIAYYGDSGAPVFSLEDEVEDGYVEEEAPIAKGILWGGDPNTGDIFYYSDLFSMRSSLTGFPRFRVTDYYFE